MAIQKQDIPILEYDSSIRSVIMPDHEKLPLRLPGKAVLGFLYDAPERYARAKGAAVLGEFRSAGKTCPIYGVHHKGQEICLVPAPVGAPAAVQLLDWLIGYGVKAVVGTGSCGTLRKIEENRFLIPVRALRDEGTSYHYLPPSRYVTLQPEAVAAIRRSLEARGLQYEEITAWTTDGFFRETPEMVKYRREEGCSVVEMECAALAACAALRGALFGELLYTADSLADALAHDGRSWGEASREIALELALDAAAEMPVSF